jgi:hypothetical protein
MENKTFKAAYCDKFKCTPDDFPLAVLWRCFYPHASAFGRFLYRIAPSYFDSDLKMIRHVEQCTEFYILQNELEDFRANCPKPGVLRGWFKVRVSGLRLFDLGRELLP